MKVFISQPMNGLTDDEILVERHRAIFAIKAEYGDDVEIVNSYFEDYEPTTGNIGLKYLAKSIELLADADAVYFCDGWRSARGCKIEYQCARQYHVKVIKE